MRTIFITTATGLQGSHLCEILLQQNWAIHATTRNLTSPSAKHLLSLDVHLTEGDWDNTTALQSSMQGCTHLFLNLMPNFSNLGSELPHAKSILTIAKEAGVKHVVYSSAFGSTVNDSPSSSSSSSHPSSVSSSSIAIPALSDPATLSTAVRRMKSDIEHLVANHQPPFETYTIIRPAFFMANMLSPRVNFMYPGLLSPISSITTADATDTNTTTTFPNSPPAQRPQSIRIWKTALQPSTRIPMIDPLDIAHAASRALTSPHNPNFNGKIIPVYNELLTSEQLLSILGESVNKTLNQQTQWIAEFDTDDEIAARKEANDIMVHVQLHMRKIGDNIQLTGEEIQEKWGFKMGSFRDYLAREHELVRKTYGSGEAVPTGGYTPQ